MAEEVLKKLERLSGELAAAQKASKQAMKEVQRAKRTTENAKRAARVKERPKPSTKRSKDG